MDGLDDVDDASGYNHWMDTRWALVDGIYGRERKQHRGRNIKRGRIFSAAEARWKRGEVGGVGARKQFLLPERYDTIPMKGTDTHESDRNYEIQCNFNSQSTHTGVKLSNLKLIPLSPSPQSSHQTPHHDRCPYNFQVFWIFFQKLKTEKLKTVPIERGSDIFVIVVEGKAFGLCLGCYGGVYFGG